MTYSDCILTPLPEHELVLSKNDDGSVRCEIYTHSERFGRYLGGELPSQSGFIVVLPMLDERGEEEIVVFDHSDDQAMVVVPAYFNVEGSLTE
jgi:hypothetical protein